MSIKTKERGYLKLNTENGPKYAHFSRTFWGQLKEVSGQDLVSLGKSFQEEKSTEEQFDAITDLLESGFRAYDLENDIEIDYNTYKVGNWLWEAMNQDDNIGTEIIETLTASLPKAKKETGK